MLNPKWDEIHRARSWGEVPNEHLYRFLRSRIWPKNTCALDIGCGYAAQTRLLMDWGFAAIGIDGSNAAIQRCRLKFPAHRFQAADVCHLPFDANSFDLIVDVCCMQHILTPDHLTAMTEIRRVLRHHGRLFSVAAKWDHDESKDTPLRRMRSNEVRGLFSSAFGFNLKSLDSSTHTINNGAYRASHWIIEAEKP